MKTLKQSTTYNLMVLMIDSTDHITGKASLTLTITASKNGAAFASITPTVTDRGSGWYNLALTTSHTDTVGDLALHITATGADPVDVSVQVLAKSVDDLATATALQTVDDFVDDLETRLTAARAGYLDKLNVTGTLAHSDAAATYKADVSALATAAALQVVDDFVDELETRLTATRAGYLDRLDVAISSRMATFTYTAPPTVSDIATAVWGATTRTLSSFGTLVADVWSYATRTLSAFGFTVDTNSDANVTAIKAKTDQLAFTVANKVDASASLDAAGVRTAVGLASANLDTQLSGIQADLDNPSQYKADVSALATAANLAAVDSVVDAIKLKVDNLPADPASETTVNTRLATSGYTAPPSVSDIVTGVWGATTRTLSSFGTLIADIWGYATRTLSAFGFTVATNSDANVTAIKAKTDNLPASPAAVGSAMTLTTAERTAIANEVESQIINEADAERVLTAITDKIASVNPSLDDLTLAGIASAVRTELATELARIDAAISTRLATAGYTAPANADITAIKAKTDNLPVSPAAVGSAMTLTAAYDKSKDDVLTPLSVVDGIVDEIKAKTTNLPSDPASNTVVNTRLSSGAYVAPANADIAAIKAKTDNLPASPADQSELEVLIAALPPAPSVNDIIAALKVAVFDGTLTFEDSIKLYNAILFGKLDGGGTGTLKFRDPADTLDRVTATVDLVTADRDHIILDLT